MFFTDVVLLVVSDDGLTAAPDSCHVYSYLVACRVTLIHVVGREDEWSRWDESIVSGGLDGGHLQWSDHEETHG